MIPKNPWIIVVGVVLGLLILGFFLAGLAHFNGGW
jgi:hypothetical protein